LHSEKFKYDSLINILLHVSVSYSRRSQTVGSPAVGRYLFSKGRKLFYNVHIYFEENVGSR
jgi:hypothetical protein